MTELVLDTEGVPLDADTDDDLDDVGVIESVGESSPIVCVRLDNGLALSDRTFVGLLVGVPAEPVTVGTVLIDKVEETVAVWLRDCGAEP